MSTATYSHSKLETFEQCPLKYKFRYIDQIKTEDESIEAFLGSRVHEVLRRFYEDLSAQKVNSIEQLLALYDAEWKKKWHPKVKKVRRDTTVEEYFAYGAHCIRNFHIRNQPFRGGETIHLEHRVEFALGKDGRYVIQGYIDRVARIGTGTFEIHDYKTGRRLPTQQRLDADRQLGLYQIGLLAQRPEAKRVELVWHYLGGGVTFRSKRTPAALALVKKETETLIAQIEEQTEFPARKSPLCDWCEYRGICPEWRTK